MNRRWPALLLLAGCGGGRSEEPAALTVSAADAGIIRAVIDYRMKNWRHVGPRPQEMLVLDVVEAFRPSRSFDRSHAVELGWGQPETWEAFFDAPRRRLHFPRNAELGFLLVTETQTVRAHDREGDWDGSRIGHADSDGYFRFVGITLSADDTEAIVEWSWYCGVLCADGWITRLVHEQGVWRIAESRMLWVS